jgi:hypothetical protein
MKVSNHLVPVYNSDQQMPLCYSCEHRKDAPFSAHSQCANMRSKVTGSQHGVDHGWFMWPFNFDPIWLQTCTGYQGKPATPRPVTAEDTHPTGECWTCGASIEVSADGQCSNCRER